MELKRQIFLFILVFLFKNILISQEIPPSVKKICKCDDEISKVINELENSLKKGQKNNSKIIYSNNEHYDAKYDEIHRVNKLLEYFSYDSSIYKKKLRIYVRKILEGKENKKIEIILDDKKTNGFQKRITILYDAAEDNYKLENYVIINGNINEIPVIESCILRDDKIHITVKKQNYKINQITEVLVNYGLKYSFTEDFDKIYIVADLIESKSKKIKYEENCSYLIRITSDSQYLRAECIYTDGTFDIQSQQFIEEKYGIENY